MAMYEVVHLAMYREMRLTIYEVAGLRLVDNDSCNERVEDLTMDTVSVAPAVGADQTDRRHLLGRH